MSFSTKSVLFNGTTQYATGGDILSFEYDDTFSLELWFKATDAEAYLISKLEGSTRFRGWGSALSAGKLVFSLINDLGSNLAAQIQTTATFNDGEWHHVVCTYSAATPGVAADMNIFVDSGDVPTTVLQDTLGMLTIVNTESFNVGSRTDGSVLLAGNVDDVSVYSFALSQGNVADHYNFGKPADRSGDSNLEGYWLMGDEAVGAALPDQSPSGDDLTLVGSPTLEEDVPVGIQHETYPVGVAVGSINRFGGLPRTAYYKMRARDSGVAPPGYITWIAQDSPDGAGVGYSSGSPTPAGSMVPDSAVVVAKWEA